MISSTAPRYCFQFSEEISTRQGIHSGQRNSTARSQFSRSSKGRLSASVSIVGACSVERHPPTNVGRVLAARVAHPGRAMSPGDSGELRDRGSRETMPEPRCLESGYPGVPFEDQITPPDEDHPGLCDFIPLVKVVGPVVCDCRRLQFRSPREVIRKRPCCQVADRAMARLFV